MKGQLAGTGDLAGRRQQRQQIADAFSQPAAPQASEEGIKRRVEDDRPPGHRADQ